MIKPAIKPLQARADWVWAPEFQAQVSSQKTRRQAIGSLSRVQLQRLSTAVFCVLDKGLDYDVWLEIIARGYCGQHGFSPGETAAQIIKRTPYDWLHGHDAEFVARVNAECRRFLDCSYLPVFLLLWIVRECSWLWLFKLIMLPVSRGRARSTFQPAPPNPPSFLDRLFREADETRKTVLKAEKEMTSKEIREYVKRKVWGER
jgi:hypothetical protein